MNEYRQRALNRVNNTSGNAGSTTSTYRQRALNRQQPKVEEPKVEIAEVEEIKVEPQTKTQTSFKPVNAREFISNKFLPVEEIEKKIYTLPDGSAANKNDYTAEEQQKLLSGEYVINPNYNPKEYMSQKILYKGQVKDAKQVEQERWDNANALGKAEIVAGKVGNTLKDIGTSAILGPIQAAEGWVDTGLTVAANAANLIGAKDTADYLTNMIKLDAVGDAKKELDSSTQSGYGRYNPSVLGVDLSDIAREGTRMFTAGVGGLPGFITSAIGGNVQESLNEGQSLGRASIYGGLTGTAEGAFEKLFDTFNLLGGGVLDKFIPKNAVAKLAITPVGEYIEEWLTQGINPFIKIATYDGEIKNPFASWENVKEWLHNNNEAGWQGFVMGLILKGTTDISNSQARQEYKNEVTKAVDKIKGLTQQQKQETIGELIKGAENSRIQIEEVMQNYKQNSQYDKYIPQVQEQNIKLPTSQENVARELPTMASQQDMLPTSRVEGQTAQTGNMEQMAENKEKVAQFSKKTDVAGEKPAFSMPKNYIDPSQDIQKATEFVNKATVEDIDALNKMVEEAEKYPDRLDLQFFAEKARARLEKISREQVENMVEEGIKQNKISYSDSIYRNLRRALGEKGYQYAKENILDKLDAAKLDNVNMKIEIANELKSYVVDELGIKKGSKESELVQKYGEKEITLDELKEATPNWENVVKADKWFRSKYDELIDMINESRTEIYPYIEEKIEATELELKVVKQQIKDIENGGIPNTKKDAEIQEKIIKKQGEIQDIKQNGLPIAKKDVEIQERIKSIQERINKKTEKLEAMKNKDTFTYRNNLRIKNDLQEQLETLKELTKTRTKTRTKDRINKLQKSTDKLKDLAEIRTENNIYKLKEKAKDLQNILDSEELWRGKRIPKRKDYYRHFQEMTEGFEALGNILATPSEISSQLSGISENTKPNAKWLGLAQRRLTNKTKYDAVGGFLNYLDSASYAINIDPEIKRIRDFTEEIRKASADNTTANRLIEYLTDYANDLAGKTNPMDRYLQKIIPGGRKTMKAISWLTNRIKSNAVLGNFNSAAAQILNLPQGLADIKNPKNIGIGFWETLTGKDSRYKDSQFITERFESDVYSQFDEKLIDQPKKFATWLLGALDEFGTKTIWNGEYSKAIDMGIKDPVRYADYRTRDLVAGRGIGELSLNQRSKTIGLLAPFTVEVSNYWGVVKDFISAKDFGGLILLQVFGHLFNEGLEELGISAGVFDLIDALIDAWNTEGGIDKKVGRVAGEYLSNTMFGQQLASLYPENGADLGVYKLPTRSELFGDADPTRMGTGSVLSKAITNPITSVVMPWGGTQLNKTAQGLSTFAKGGSYTKDAEGKDKLKYPVEQTPSNAIKSALFGKWATPGAKDYIDRGFKPLSANQTEAYEKAMKAGISSDDFFKVYDATRGIESDKDRSGKTIENSKSKKLKEAIDKATPKLTSKQRKILYDAFNVSKTVQGGSGLPTQSELRANLPKVEIKIEK